MSKSRCEVCGRLAVYDSPRDFCDLHWAVWFCGPEPGELLDGKWTVKRYSRLIRWSMRNSWQQHGRPVDWRTQWRNVENEVILTTLGAKPL